MKIADIDFPSAMLAALRDSQLVVFAGAGVSKEEPAGLPDFRELTDKIARATGRSLGNEPPERFLGELEHAGVDVHDRAKEVLLEYNAQPAAMHADLLRLYPDSSLVRIITTNFDTLFEQAGEDALDSSPDVFQAPALPLGSNFEGIVHVHGALDRPKGMVLTDADFGRAYLTEGWARRFLLDVFRSFTVLFIGYSHDDVIMNYLARALPKGDTKTRYALTGESGLDKWKLLGTEPVVFEKPAKDDYRCLYESIRVLASYMQRSILDWQNEISGLAKQKPSSWTPEETEVMKDALLDLDKVRTFTRSVSSPSPELVDWLDEHHFLDGLYTTSELGERDREFANWLAERFACTHSDALFQLISRHETRIAPAFWFELGRVVGTESESRPDKRTLSQWVSLLLATSPAFSRNALGRAVLSRLGTRCIEQDLTNDLLAIFDAMVSSRLLLRPGLPWHGGDADDSRLRLQIKFDQIGNRHSMNKLWEKGLKPRLNAVAEPLLTLVSRHLAGQHRVLSVWKRGNRWWDPLTFRRQAIEPHAQDNYPNEIDVMIDVARDCVEWLACHKPEIAARWCDQLVQERAPLLRRIGIHALIVRTDLNPNEKIDWLTANIQLRDQAARHELFLALREIYPNASTKRRRHLLDTVLAFRWPSEDAEEIEHLTSRQHFDWLHWLHDALPSCDLTKQALDEVKGKYPDWEARKYPDLSYWTEGAEGEFVAPKSPWSVEELLARPITAAWVHELVSFRSQEPFGPSREGVLLRVTEAARLDADWGIRIADQLHASEDWETDLWEGLLSALGNADINKNQVSCVFRHLAKEQLQENHTNLIAKFLQAWVKNSNASHPVDQLEQANSIAAHTWSLVTEELNIGGTDDWLMQAINHAAGVLADFWVISLSLWRQQEEEPPNGLCGQYRAMMTLIATATTVTGRLGRCVFAERLNFLLAVDENWTKKYMLPWFSRDKETLDYRAVWDGFLIAPVLSPPVAALMSSHFLDAITRIKTHFTGEGSGGHRAEKLVGAYTVLLAYFAEDPLETWIPKLFVGSREEDRRHFTFEIHHRLANMKESQQREWWDRWLRAYWQNRLQGVPAPLTSAEIESMLDWLPCFRSIFPEAVELAIRMPRTSFQDVHITYELNTSDHWKDYPESVAKLLIYLGKCECPGYAWSDCKKLFQKLLGSELPAELARKLQELATRLGLT